MTRPSRGSARVLAAVAAVTLSVVAAGSAWAADEPAAGDVGIGRNELQLGTMKAISGKEFRLGAGEEANGDVYAAVAQTVIHGTVHGDVLSVGTRFTLGQGATVERDIDVAATNASVAGQVGSRARIAAFETEISGEIGADAVVLAWTVHLEPSSVVRGSLAVSGGSADLDGLVDGPAWVKAGKVNLNGRVSGDLTVVCDELHFGPGAHVEGNLVYQSRTPVTVPPGAISGNVTRTEKAPERPVENAGSPFVRDVVLNVYLAFAALVAGCLLVLFFRPAVDGAIARTVDANLLATSFGIGLVALLALVVVGVVCCLVLPLALAVFSGLAALGYFGGLIGKMILGVWILRPMLRTPAERIHPLFALVVGIAAVFVVDLVPILGGLFWFAVTVTGMGATLLQVREGRGRVPPPADVVTSPV